MTTLLPGLGGRIAIRVHGTPIPRRNPNKTRAFGVAPWENENAPAGAGNTTRGLTHSLDYTEEGLA